MILFEARKNGLTISSSENYSKVETDAINGGAQAIVKVANENGEFVDKGIVWERK